MADRPEAPAEGEAKKPVKSGKKKLIILIGAGLVLLLAAGAGAFILMSSGKDSGAAASAESELKGEAGKPEKGEKSGHGASASSAEGDAAMFKFEKPFFVTLADANSHKVIQFFLTVEFNDPALAGVVKKSEDKYRDAVYTEASKRTRAEVTSLEGKERLRRDLINAFDSLLEKPGAVHNVYFPDYVLPL